jgi:hypothetical protein
MRRVLAAIAIGFVASLALGYLGIECLGAVVDPDQVPDYLEIPISIAVIAIPGIVAAAAVANSGRKYDSETRCRKCGYILRGLREPRCPECGEPV